METRSKIIAVDFDGTLCEDKWPCVGMPRTDVIDYIKCQQENGAKIILWTCRTGDKLTEAIDWCFTCGLEFDAINENVEEAILWYGGDTRKIFADEYIDDKAAKYVKKTTFMIDDSAYVNELEKENAELKERVEELSKTINKRVDYFRKFNENKYKFEIRELRDENDNLKEKNKNLQKNLYEMADELNEVENERDSLVEEYAGACEEIARLKDQINDLSIERDNLLSKYNDLHFCLHEKDNSIMAANCKIIEKDKIIQEQKKEIERLKEMLFPFK